MKFQITGIKKISNAEKLVLIIKGENADGGKLLLISNQALINSFREAIRKCRVFDFSGNDTTLQGHAVFHVNGFTPVEPEHAENAVHDEKPDSDQNTVMETTPKNEHVVESKMPATAGQNETQATPELNHDETEEYYGDEEKTTIDEIQFVPVVGYKLKIESAYFKGYETLDSFLESVHKQNNKKSFF